VSESDQQVFEKVFRNSLLNLKIQMQLEMQATARVDFHFFVNLLARLNEDLNLLQIPYKKENMAKGEKTFANGFLSSFFEDIIMAMMIKAIIKSSGLKLGLDLNTIGLDQLRLIKIRVVD
jgi:hypothetical protein